MLPDTCPEFAPGRIVGRVVSLSLLEASGLAASRHNAGVLWTHNDSGNEARLFALALDGRQLGAYRLVGAACVDWEDVAVGPGPVEGASYLYVADVGTNVTPRDVVVVDRVLEPAVKPDQASVQADLAESETFQLSYPDAQPHDAEALMVDPLTGDLYIVEKTFDARPNVYRARAPLWAGRMRLEHIMTLELEKNAGRGGGLVTAGDISAAGDAIVIKTYINGYLWLRPPGTSVVEALRKPPCRVPLAKEPQGEAIAFSADGNGYFTLSEGLEQPIYFFARR
jgi:hypothetical protein